jgi:hypothetical protein
LLLAFESRLLAVAPGEVGLIQGYMVWSNELGGGNKNCTSKVVEGHGMNWVARRMESE